MGLVRFLTVYDDEHEEILQRKHMRMLDIASLSSFYQCNGLSYLDNMNTCSRDFIRMKNDFTQCTSADIPPGVFQHIFEKTAQHGYRRLLVICPNGKWTPYYKNAVHAANNFRRNELRNNADDFFDVQVVNSRGVGIAPVIMTNTLAKMYARAAVSPKMFEDYANNFAKSSVTYLLTDGCNEFSDFSDLRAFRITSTRVFSLDISESIEEVRIDKFTKYAGNAIKRSGGRYAVSYGYGCKFIGNVLGRLERDYNFKPLITAQYSIASAQLLGSNAFCVHLGDYI